MLDLSMIAANWKEQAECREKNSHGVKIDLRLKCDIKMGARNGKATEVKRLSNPNPLNWIEYVVNQE